ncbi:Glutamyl aminopeptidase, partial [Araneus ventricosus]
LEWLRLDGHVDKAENHPSLTIERKENSSNQYTIQQRRFSSTRPLSYVWQIPLTYHTSESQEVSTMFLNSSAKVNISVPSAKWIKFNTNFTGYYLVNYDKKSWEIFTDELRNNHTVFSPSDRLNLLYEAFTLASAGYLEYAVPLNLSRYLKKEKYHAVWNTALSELKRIKWLFRGDKETEKILHPIFHSLSEPIKRTDTASSILRLPDLWRKGVDSTGDYIEGLETFQASTNVAWAVTM